MGRYDELKVYDICNFSDGVVISWGCPSVGFGEYTIYRNRQIKTECMDSNDSRGFSQAIWNALDRINKVGVVEGMLSVPWDLDTYMLKVCNIVE